LIDNYKSDKTDSEEYKLAHRLVDNIVATYYPEFKGKELDDEANEALLKNVQQRAGIIVNMFTDPLSQSINYKESNLVDIPTPEEKKD
jgi:non-homologous end joining protein Ku